MLTVYSTQGSPGASTTTIHMAAHWASTGREVLLIEADPDGGSLSHNLGIQFTPGSASFVASGLPVLSNHLIDHSQDVLFENLHVMPAPSSPTGARGICNTFADRAEELRAISEDELAVIIDGGRITDETAASRLTTHAAGVLVVSRNNRQLSTLEHLRGVFPDDPGSGGPLGCAATVGQSLLDESEWLERFNLTFSGSIELVSEMAGDLSVFLARNKRKSKKWRVSLEQVAEQLYAQARPPLSDAPRLSRPAPRTAAAQDAAAAAEAASSGFLAAPRQPPPVPAPAAQPGHRPTQPMMPAESLTGYGHPPMPLPPEAGADFGGQPQPMAPPAHPGYPSAPAPRQDFQPPPFAPPPMSPQQAHPGYPVDPAAHPGHAPPPAPPAYGPPPAYGQEPGPPPGPHPYTQPPGPPPDEPPMHGQPQEPHPYTQPPGPPPGEPPMHGQPPGRPQEPHPYTQPPGPPPGEPPREARPVPRPAVTATGSFREWAAKLHSLDTPDKRATREGGG